MFRVILPIDVIVRSGTISGVLAERLQLAHGIYNYLIISSLDSLMHHPWSMTPPLHCDYPVRVTPVRKGSAKLLESTGETDGSRHEIQRI